MNTTLETKNTIACIYINTISAINLSGEKFLLDQPMETTFLNDEIEELSATGIDFSGKITKEALLLIRDWLKEADIETISNFY